MADSQYTSRRALLKGLPAAGAAMALPGTTTAAETDPVVAHYHKWVDARREWSELIELPGNGNADTPVMLAVQDREFQAEEDMLSTIPITMAGVSALAAVLWSHIGPVTTDPEEYAREADNWDCKLIRAIWRAGTGQDGYPVTGVVHP